MTPSTTATTAKTTELKVHQMLYDFPRLPDDQRENLRRSIAEHGILSPLAVIQVDGGGYLVIDGRHRLECANDTGLQEVPIRLLPPDTDPLTFALESAVAGRNLTKSGIVLVLFLKHPSLAENANARKKAGKEPGDKITSYHALAEKYGVPYEYFPQLAALRERAIGCDMWDRIQASILAGDCSIPTANAGLGGVLSSKGKKRSDPQYAQLLLNFSSTVKTAFGKWQTLKFQPKEEERMFENFMEALVLAPEKFRALQVEAIVASWPEHEKQLLAKALGFKPRR